MKNATTLLKLVVWLAIAQLPGVVGVQFVYPNMTWYNTLAKPVLMPPNGTFGLIWAVLYVLLGVSAFLAFREKLHGRAMMLFIGQLALNACWTPLFFGAHSLLGAMLLLPVMLGELAWLCKAFKPINRTATWLLLPYGLWLMFALYLTAGTWWMN